VLLMDMLLWFASRDIHIAATFSRGFYWTDINLWFADLPRNACVVLSGNDALLSAQVVQRMLAATTPHVKVGPGACCSCCCCCVYTAELKGVYNDVPGVCSSW
jgi:streptolysin S family bacteriocin protoxin